MQVSTDPEKTKILGSYADPAGSLYEENGRILRGINTEFAEFYAGLLDNPTVRRMAGREIIDTVVQRNNLHGYSLTLEHRKLSPLSFCYEWPAQMLKDAALLTLDICINLVDEGLVLKDAYPWNVVFEGPRPVFVDFTSIMPQDPNILWVAYDQFCRFFLYPLAISSCGLGKVARAFLFDYINGVSDTELVKLVPPTAILRMPWLISRVHLPRLLLGVTRRFSTEKTLTNLSARLKPSTEARRSFFLSLRKTVQKIPLPVMRSGWSNYYADMGTFLRPSEFNTKQVTVARILRELGPKTVVDIGCNRGGYSVIAEAAGARVTSFDTDENSVALLYELAKERHLDTLPLVMDFLSPSPPCGWRSIEYSAAPERFRSEMALALALVHHLAITCRQTFERIAPALADYADRWLLTEFVPLADPRSQEIMLTHRRDMSWYTLEGFLQALGKVFEQVETFPSYPEGRVLILCKK